MTSVEVKFSGTVDLFSVSLDGVKLMFKNGAATATLPGGKEYRIQWFVQGAPATNYKLEVTRPKEAAFTHSATLDASKKDAGIFWLTLNPEKAGTDAE